MNRIARRIIAVIPAVLLQALWFFVLLRWLAPYAAIISYILTFAAVLFVLYIISSHSEGTYKTLWLLVIIGLPVTGAVLYLLFGNKRTAKPLRRKLERADRKSREMLNDMYGGEIPGAIDLSRRWIHRDTAQKALCAAGMNRRLAQTICTLQEKTGFAPVPCDGAEYFPLGELMWERMLQDLEQAEHFIFAEYFIIEDGDMLDSMVEIMARKAAEGVDVRVMYDDLGSISTFSAENVEELRAKGIKCASFNPLRAIKGTVNYRDHRKMLVIDGRVAYSGGVNLADEYINHIEKYGHWKDIGFRLTGRPVHSYTGMFAEFWNAFSGEPIPRELIEAYFKQRSEGLAGQISYSDNDAEAGKEPGAAKESGIGEKESGTPAISDAKHKTAGGLVLSYYDQPIIDAEVSNNLYIDLLSQAEEYAWFYTPYLMPGDFLLDAFVKAAERGVDVRIIMPGIPDKKVVYRMSRSYYYPLIKAGVKIYEYTPGFVHAKGCIIDDKLCTVGTVNLDYRSLFLHFENNSVFWKAPVIHEMKQDFLETLKHCRERTMDNIDTGFVKWLIDGVLRIFAPLC